VKLEALMLLAHPWCELGVESCKVVCKLQCVVSLPGGVLNYKLLSQSSDVTQPQSIGSNQSPWGQVPRNNIEVITI
jgi:hypothetical protein